MEHFFSPNSSGDLRSDAHQSQIIRGNADEDHTQIIGGIQSNYWGGYIPPGFWHPCLTYSKLTLSSTLTNTYLNPNLGTFTYPPTSEKN